MEDLTFYSSSGEPIAYTDDGEHVWAFDGRPAGYIFEDSIYAYTGAHLGWFVDGWVRDHQGDAVFATASAGRGPRRPTFARSPTRALKQTAPMKGPRQRPGYRAKSGFGWSYRSSLFFFSPRSLVRPEGLSEPSVAPAPEATGLMEFELDLGDSPDLDLELDLDEPGAPSYQQRATPPARPQAQPPAQPPARPQPPVQSTPPPRPQPPARTEPPAEPAASAGLDDLELELERELELALQRRHENS